MTAVEHDAGLGVPGLLSSRRARRVLAFVERGGLPLTLLGLIVVFSLVNSSFLTTANLLDLLEQNAALAIVAVGSLVVIVAGGIDLSVGSLTALAAMVMAWTFGHGVDPILAIVAGVAAGAAVGLLQGVLVSVIGVNAVIVTLAGLIWARGVATAMSGARSLPVDTGYALWITDRHFGYVSFAVVAATLAFAAGALVLRRTRFGRHLYALGGSREAARQVGLPVTRIGVVAFVASGACAGIAGVVEGGRLAVGQPNMGTGLELDAIAAVVVGGASLSGGEGRVWRTILGVAFIATMNNGLSLLGLNDAYVYLYKGLIVLFALSIEVAARRLSATGARL
jgi:ribose/xylose/arabinose/galactoside ABC-type transport system permease subunit